MSGALETPKVIELGQMVSAPCCARLFSDFGMSPTARARMDIESLPTDDDDPLAEFVR